MPTTATDRSPGLSTFRLWELSEDFPVTTSDGAFACGNGPLALGVTPLLGHSPAERLDLAEGTLPGALKDVHALLAPLETASSAGRTTTARKPNGP
uniref:hypothetical protein n=1 Tax=Frankia sp. Cj3 TaxID=2880976 RepID=UPI001EF60807